MIARKSKNPKQNARDFAQENRDQGEKNEVDLVLQKMAGLQERSESEFIYA